MTTNRVANKNLTGHLLDGKYELLEQLGEGGMAIVYKARRQRIDDEVAVKVLRPDITLDTVSQVRFEREAKSAARIKHPNIVTIHDFGTSDDGFTYLVMEKLDGPTLESVLENCMGLSVERTLNIILPVCQAISAAHQEGIIHRDLKPSNIILHKLKDGTELVKVVDFGIVKLTRTGEALTQVNNLLGTPYYMSPEQCFSRDLDARSDIYSLGVIIYEMLTGRLPFNEPTILEILQAHVEQVPHPLRRYKSDISPSLDNVVLRALSKKPEERQATATLLAHELSSSSELHFAQNSNPAASGSNWKLKTTDLLPATTPTMNRGTTGMLNQTGAIRLETLNRRSAKPVPDFDLFIGRKREMDRLTSEFQQLQNGKCRPLVFLGDKGIGLSRLAEEFKRRSRKQGGAALVTRFQEPDGQTMFLPLQTMLDLIRRMLSISRKEFSQETVFTKIIAERSGIELPPCLFENRALTDAEKWQVFETISNIMVQAMGNRQCLLIFDDLQYAHELILELISYLLRNYRTHLLFIFMSHAEAATKKGHPCQEWLAALSRSGCEVVRLPQLSDLEMRLLLESTFGYLEISERNIDRILSVSQGNPYYLIEIVRLLLNEGKIKLENNELWRCESIDDLKLPESLQQLADLKLAKLDEALLEVLRQASVIGQEFSFNLLESLTDIDEDELIDHLENAVKKNIIQEVQKKEDEYRFCDHTLWLVLYESVPRRRRKKLHLQVAQAIEKEAGNNRTKLMRQSERLLHHYHEAGQNGKVFFYGRTAADGARSRLAIADAERYYSWALEAAQELTDEETPPDTMEWAELQLSSAELSVYLSRLEEADKKLAIAQKLSTEHKSLMGRICLVKSRLEFNRSEFEAALNAAETGMLAAQSSGNAVTENHLLLMLGRTFSALGRTEESLDALECNLEISRQLGDHATESQVLSLLGITLCNIGNFRQGIALIDEGLKLARTHKDRPGELLGLRRLGNGYWQIGQLERSLEAYECGLEMARVSESRIGEGIFHNGIGDVYRSLGEMELARERYQQYLTISQNVGNKSGEATANHNLGLIALELGMIPDAIKLLESALKEHERLGELRLLAEAHFGLGRAKEQMGQFDAAKKAYQTTIEMSERINYPNLAWQGHYGLASCHWTFGNAEEARNQLNLAQEFVNNLQAALPPDAKLDEFSRDKNRVKVLLEEIEAATE